MRKILSFVTGIFLLNIFINAQGPPPPLIYSAPDKSEIKKYISKEDNFEIDFVGTVSEREGNQARNTKMYLTKFNGSIEGVKVTTLAKPIEKSKLKDFILSEKKDYLAADDTELIYEKEFFYKDFKGYEFGFKEDIKYVRVRILTIGVKVFEIYADVSNWHILSDNYKDKVKEFEVESDRFFNSFKYIPTVIKGFIDSSVLQTTTKTFELKNDKTDDNPLQDTYSSKNKIFTSAKGAFSSYFPFKPKKDIVKVDSTEGVVDFVSYSAASSYVSYVVSYVDSPTIVEIEDEKQLNYDKHLELILTHLDGTLVNQKDFSQYGVTGKDYTIKTSLITYTMRIFFVKQRLFRISVITAGTPNPKTGKLTTAKTKLIERFFDSFKVNELPQPKFQAVSLPDDFGSIIENNKYKSSYFNFSSSIPEGWTFLDSLETDLIASFGSETVEGTKKYKGIMENSAKNTKILFIAFKKDLQITNSPLIMVAGESLSTPVFLPKSVIETNLQTLEDDEELTIGFNQRTIDGVQFAWYETRNKTNQTLNRFYVANVNKLALEFLYTYRSKDELNDFEAFLNTIKFNKINEQTN